MGGGHRERTGHWALDRDSDGRVQLGHVPDVLVDGDALLIDEAFEGVPDAVVEVWSPGTRWRR